MIGGNPVHNIQVSHDWSEYRRSVDDRGATTVHERCGKCGAIRSVLDLTTVAGQSLAETPTAELQEFWRDITGKMQRFVDSFDAMWDDLLEGTQYSDTVALVSDLTNRYQGVVDAQGFSFRELQRWIEISNKKQKLKMLLILQQGLVCNRCDKIFSLAQLTVDHIVPDRSNSKLTNLQLLCETCHNEKADKSPGPNDISPFAFEGEACLHPLTCEELNRLIEAAEERKTR